METFFRDERSTVAMETAALLEELIICHTCRQDSDRAGIRPIVLTNKTF
jgi:hypothetical protein